jgi:acyl carrier protein
MTRQEFLKSMDALLELPQGTLKGPETLNSYQKWDSLALISFIALADSNNHVSLSARQLMRCMTVSELLSVAKVEA